MAITKSKWFIGSFSLKVQNEFQKIDIVNGKKWTKVWLIDPFLSFWKIGQLPLNFLPCNGNHFLENCIDLLTETWSAWWQVFPYYMSQTFSWKLLSNFWFNLNETPLIQHLYVNQNVFFIFRKKTMYNK